MSASPHPSTARWYTSVWFVLLSLFALLGPLGLPLLWASPKFPLWAKLLLTGLVVGWTVWMIAAVASIVRSASQESEQLRLLLP